MNCLPENVVFYFGLTFRILFYTFLIGLMFFDVVRKFKTKFNKLINVLILFFALCYIGFIITMFFNCKNYIGIETPLIILSIWCVFFPYLFIINNRVKPKKIFHKTTTYIMTVLLLTILCSNAFLNTQSGPWGSFNIVAHGSLSLLLPLSAYIFSVIKPKGKILGLLILIVTITQFLFGISLSYGFEGFLSDDTEFSIIFILNTFLFIIAGLSNIYNHKTLSQKSY